jgi:hypothetical protein
MSLFHSILSQLQEKINKETTTTESIAAIISTTIGTTITKDQITVHGSTIRIKSSPTLKMAVSLNKQKILTAIQQTHQSITTIG